MVDFGGLGDKAKKWAGDNPEKADSYVDKGSDAAKGHLAGHEEQVDQFGQKTKDYLHPDEQPPAVSSPRRLPLASSPRPRRPTSTSRSRSRPRVVGARVRVVRLGGSGSPGR